MTKKRGKSEEQKSEAEKEPAHQNEHEHQNLPEDHDDSERLNAAVHQNLPVLQDNCSSTSDEFYEDDIPYLHRKNAKLSSADLEYCRQNEIRIQTGAFKKEEDDRIKKNFQKFLHEHPTVDGDWVLGFGMKRHDRERDDFVRDTKFWARLSHGLSRRPLRNIFFRSRKILHSNAVACRRPYTDEEVKTLLAMSGQVGHDFVRMSKSIKRTPHSLEAKLREIRAGVKYGPFTAEECKKLMSAVASVTASSNDVATLSLNLLNIKWNKVAKLMGERTMLQCRMQWKKMRVKFGTMHRVQPLQLIERIYEDGASNEGEVDWRQIATVFDLVDAATALRLYRKVKMHFQKFVKAKERSFRRNLKKMRKFLQKVFADQRAMSFGQIYEEENKEDGLDSIEDFDEENVEIPV